MSKPTDAWDIPEKAAEKHREALRRSPLYHQEWEAAFQSYLNSLPQDLKPYSPDKLRGGFSESPQGQQLCDRWGLAPGMALHPDDKLWDSQAQAFFKDPGEAVQVIHHQKTRLVAVPENEKLTTVEYESELDITPHLKNGHYLSLEIDLSQSQGQIEVEVKEKVKKYQEAIGKVAINEVPVRGPSRDIYLDEEPPSGPITIFQVWDMKMNKKENESAWTITKKLYPDITSKYPNDWDIDEDTAKLSPEAQQARKYLRKVERAIRRAQEEIDSINPTA